MYSIISYVPVALVFIYIFKLCDVCLPYHTYDMCTRQIHMKLYRQLMLFLHIYLQFIPFSERIANLNVDVFHYVSCVPDDEEEGNTFMQRAIEKWSVQNGTLGMEACLRELPDCTSLAQLLHSREVAVGVVLKHLDLRDPLSLQPVLE